MPETAPQADPDSASPAGAHDDGTTTIATAGTGTGTDSPGPGSAGAGGATRATGT